MPKPTPTSPTATMKTGPAQPDTTRKRPPRAHPGPVAPTDSTILIALRGLTPSLVPSLRRVALHILKDPARASGQTIMEVARAANTSETTVMRLCHQLGVRGYRELRAILTTEVARDQALASTHAGNAQRIGSDIARDDDLETIIELIAFNDQQAIADTVRVLDRDALARAAELLVDARRVDIVGVGASAIVALDLQQKLHRIGLIALAWHDMHAALTAAALLTPADVLIAISHSGQTVDILETVSEARRHGAAIVGVTSVPRSELAVTADFTLVTAGRETTFRSGSMTSRIAALAVVDVLFVAAAQRRFDASAAALDATWTAVRHRQADHRRAYEEHA
jgi:DNA-binding MurR/RpiR family transcriptional regulator